MIVTTHTLFLHNSGLISILYILASFVSSTFTFEVDPPSNNSDQESFVNRGRRVTLICTVSSITQPAIVVKGDPLIYPEYLIADIATPPSPEPNLWRFIPIIDPFRDNNAARYTFETKFGSDVVQSRQVTLSIRGNCYSHF